MNYDRVVELTKLVYCILYLNLIIPIYIIHASLHIICASNIDHANSSKQINTYTKYSLNFAGD